jgi:hypothetical protein
LRAPADMSASFGPKNQRSGRAGRAATATNGSAQLWWLKQRIAGPGGNGWPSTRTRRYARTSTRIPSVVNQ